MIWDRSESPLAGGVQLADRCANDILELPKPGQPGHPGTRSGQVLGVAASQGLAVGGT